MTTDPKREALAAEVKRLAENYAVLDTKAARKALYAAIDSLAAAEVPAGECFNNGTVCARCGHTEVLTAPSAGHGEGWRPISEAPEEGNFLVFMPDEHRPFQVMYRKKNVTIIGGAFAFDLTAPTHFMLLPPTPKDNQGTPA